MTHNVHYDMNFSLVLQRKLVERTDRTIIIMYLHQISMDTLNINGNKLRKLISVYL